MSSKSPKKSRSTEKSSPKGDSSATGKLPFEPAQNPKKAAKKNTPAAVAKPSDQSVDKSPSKSASKLARSSVKEAAAIPEIVSRRMVRRVALFSGIPAFLGMATLVISYLVISKHWLNLPHVAVLLVNLGFFGLSVLGLSYGAISASWDEERVGSWFGWAEFKTNFARLRDSWQAAKQKPSA